MNGLAVTNCSGSRGNEVGRNRHDRAFLASASLLFFCSTVATIIGCTSMSAMRGMPMPGNWTMSMTWMRMPEDSWIDAATLFVGMWIIMMMAMMLPSLIPMLLRYRSALRKIDTIRLGRLTASIGVGYFFAWALVGIAIFPLGTMIAALEMKIPGLARITPIAIAVIVIFAGAFQFTARKAHCLTCCREIPQSIGIPPVNAGAALRNGLRLGARCIYCCANLTLILIVVGIMNLSAMVIVTLAISAERLASNSGRAARIVGVGIIAAGIFILARAVRFY